MAERDLSLTVLEDRGKWRRFKKKWDGCTKCDIGKVAFKHVFARGTLPCDLLFIGEAPGKSEDVLGKPFTGKSGELLDLWISAMQQTWVGSVMVDRKEDPELLYAIFNTVSCRPCDGAGAPNRAPTDEERKNCKPRLDWMIEFAKPMAFVLLGKVAADEMFGLLPEGKPVLELRHPAFCLRRGGAQSVESLEECEKLCHFVRDNIIWVRNQKKIAERPKDKWTEFSGASPGACGTSGATE